MAQWIRHLNTNQGIPGSNPGGVVTFLDPIMTSKVFSLSFTQYDSKFLKM